MENNCLNSPAIFNQQISLLLGTSSAVLFFICTSVAAPGLGNRRISKPVAKGNGSISIVPFVVDMNIDVAISGMAAEVLPVKWIADI